MKFDLKFGSKKEEGAPQVSRKSMALLMISLSALGIFLFVGGLVSGYFVRSQREENERLLALERHAAEQEATPVPTLAPYLDNATLQATEEPGPSPEPVSKTVHTVQVGAFSKAANARTMADKFSAQGFEAFIQVGKDAKGRTLNYVLVGQLATRAEAEALAAKIKKKNGTKGLVRTTEIVTNSGAAGEEAGPPPADKPDGLVWSVQVGSFRDADSAWEHAAVFAAKGLAPCVIKVSVPGRETWEVQLREFSTEKGARSFVDIFRENEGIPSHVTAWTPEELAGLKQCGGPAGQ